MKRAAKLAGLGFGVALVVTIVGASAVLKALVDVIEGPDQPHREHDWPA